MTTLPATDLLCCSPQYFQIFHSYGCRFFRALWLPLVLAVVAAEERAEGCSGLAKKCSNQTISAPFWLRDNKAGRACGLSDFEVTCVNNNTPVLQSSVLLGHGFAIMDIKYEERSLHVVDRGKLELLSDGCLPMQNTSAKLGVQFRIAPVNRDLVLYNCTEKAGAAALAARRRRELVPTGMGCGNGSKVFVRAGGRYNETSGYGGHAVQGCAAAVLPVLGSSSGEVNASDYERLVRDGFLLTWGLPPAPPPPRKLTSKIIF